MDFHGFSWFNHHLYCFNTGFNPHFPGPNGIAQPGPHLLVHALDLLATRTAQAKGVGPLDADLARMGYQWIP